MVATNQEKALQLVLAHEGGYSDHPKDPGGATNFGITQAVYDAYRRNHGLPTQSVRHIAADEIAIIYDRQYWDTVRADWLPAGVDYAVFDYAVNSGPSRAVKDLQRTVNALGYSPKIGVDGVCAQGTIAAVCEAASRDECGLIVAYCNRRLAFLRSLSTWGTFGKGWKRRVVGDMDGAQTGDHGVVDYAVNLARQDLSYPIDPADLPTVIGGKFGEHSGKALEASQSKMRTSGGVGTALAGTGATGQTLLSTAEQVQPHVGDTILGRIALIGFVVLILAGVGLVAFEWYKKQQEKAAL